MPLMPIAALVGWHENTHAFSIYVSLSLAYTSYFVCSICYLLCWSASWCECMWIHAKRTNFFRLLLLLLLLLVFESIESIYRLFTPLNEHNINTFKTHSHRFVMRVFANSGECTLPFRNGCCACVLCACFFATESKSKFSVLVNRQTLRNMWIHTNINGITFVILTFPLFLKFRFFETSLCSRYCHMHYHSWRWSVYFID